MNIFIIKQKIPSFIILEYVLKLKFFSGNTLNIPGNVLVLESDGSEIEDNVTLSYYSSLSEIFILLKHDQEWQRTNEIESTINNNGANEVTTENYTIISDESSRIISETQLNQGQVFSSSEQDMLITVPSPEMPLEIFQSNTTVPDDSNSSDTTNTEPQPHSNDSISTSNASTLEINSQFKNFKINWSQISKISIDILENGEKLPKSLQNDLIHNIVNDLRKISTRISMSTFRTVANEITTKYSRSFAIKDNSGTIIDINSVTLATALLNHNFYLNRSQPPKRTHCGESNSKQLKRINNFSDGVPNFYGNEVGDEFEEERMRLWLREHADVKNLSTSEKKLELENFENTYSSQRKFLNNVSNPPLITEIKTQWPHLLKHQFMLSHYEMLMKNNLTKFTNELEVLAPIIVAKVKKNTSNQIDKPQNLIFDALIAITSKFSENFDSILKVYPVCF